MTTPLTHTTLSLIVVALLASAAEAHARPTTQPRQQSGADAALRFEWELSWVQVFGLPNQAVQLRVNRALVAEVARERSEMRRHLRDWEPTGGYASTLDAGMTVGVLTDELLSVTVSSSTMYSGAARPNHSLRTVTFDLRTGSKVPAAALLQPGAGARAAALVDAKLRADPDYSEGGEYYLAPVRPEHLTGILVERDGLRFLFGDQQLGPHAVGLPEAKLTWAELDGVVARDGAIARHVARSAGLTGALRR